MLVEKFVAGVLALGLILGVSPAVAQTTPPPPTPPPTTPPPTTPPPNQTPPGGPAPRAAPQFPPAGAAAGAAYGQTVLGAVRPIEQRFSVFSTAFDLPGAPGSTGFATTGMGLAAGDVPGGWSAWGSGSYTRLEHDFFATRYDGSTITGGFGLDRKVGEGLTVGLSASLSRTDLDTPYSGGGSVTDGVTILPYIALTPTDWLSLDLAAGWAWNDTQATRDAGGVIVRGTQPSRGYVAAGNLTASRWYGTMLLSAKTGFVASRDGRARFVESDGTVVAPTANDLVQGRFGASVGWYVDPVLAGVSLTYVNDFAREDTVVPGGGVQPANDRDGFVLEGSLTLYGSGAAQGVTASLTASTEIGRRQMESHTVGLNVRADF